MQLYLLFLKSINLIIKLQDVSAVFSKKTSEIYHRIPANFHQQLNKELNKKKSVIPWESKDKSPKITPNVFNVFNSFKTRFNK